MATRRQLDKGKASVGSLVARDLGLADSSHELRSFTNTVAFGDTTAKTLGTLPANAVPVDIKVDVTAAFDDTGTDLLNVGKTGTDNHFINALDVAATGRKAPTLLNMGVTVGTSAITVVGKYTGGNANAAAGSAVVTVFYIVP